MIILFANIFFHSVGYIFVFCLIVSFAVQKLLSLIKFYMFIFVFILPETDPKILLQLMSKYVLPVFYSRSFVISGFIYKSLIHFVFETALIPFFYMLWSSFPSTYYWGDYLFSIIYSCLLCHQLTDLKCLSSFLDTSFSCIYQCVYFYASTKLFWLL